MRTNTGQVLYIPRIGQRANLQHPLMKGCVAWWPLTDGGGDATDILPNSYDGTATSSPTFESTSIGTAASFTGGSRFNVSSNLWNNYFNGKTKLTMSGWYYADALTDQSIGLNCFDGIGSEFLVRFDNSRLQGIISNGGFVETANNVTAATAGQWQHYAITVDMGVGEMKVYLDSVLLTTKAFSSRTFANLTGDPAIGASTSGARPFTGEQQNIRLWSRVITPEEVSVLYTNPWAGLETTSSNRYFFFSSPSPPPIINPFSRIITSSTILNTSGKTVIRRGA